MQRLFLRACFLFPLALLIGSLSARTSSAGDPLRGSNLTATFTVAADAKEEEEIKKNLAKLSEADRKLALEQKMCVIENEPLGSMGVPIKLSIKGQPVFICCKGCKDDAEKNPDETLKKVAELKKKNKK